jgi:hypothetical protein
LLAPLLDQIAAERKPVCVPQKLALGELAINLKVAQQLGIAVSPAFQLRADEVVE